MKKFLMLFSALLIVLSSCGRTLAEAKPQSGLEESIDSLEVHYIDVGGCHTIKCGSAAMLIDAGEDDKGTLVQNYISKQGVKSLDYKRYEITKPVVGAACQFGDAEFTIIAPDKKDYGDEANNYSVGIILKHGDKKFIFTGDAEEEAEEDILHNKIDISADVLKVGHHGSKTFSSEAFIEAVSPEYAVISCEENNEYGHPHAATLNTLRGAKIKVFRTDEQGSLIAVSDGKEIVWNAAPSDTWKAGEPYKSSADTAPAIEEKQYPAAQDIQELTYVLNVKA